MKRVPFQFKKFSVRDDHSAMKLSTDAVLLGAFADFSNDHQVLDIGTGCGILALITAQKSSADITAIDLDPGSVKDAHENFESSPWKSRFILQQSSLQEFSANGPGNFDHIITNPPFFNRDLLSPDAIKNRAKHDRYLSLPELFQVVRNLLIGSGKFSLILPFSSGPVADRLASEFGFWVFRKLIILPTPAKPANRILLEYRLQPARIREEQSLLIRNEKGAFTPEYRLFTKDFYLHF